DHRIHALRMQVEREGRDVHVPGPLPVAEDASLHPLRAGEQSELGAGDPRTAIVVRVHRQDHAVAPCEVLVHVLDLIGVHVGRGDLDRGGEVEDHRALRRRLPQLRHRIADLDGELRLRGVEHLGGELISNVGQVRRAIADLACAVEDQPLQLLPAVPQHHVPPHRGGRGVHVDHDLVADPLDRVDRAGDEVGTR
ncbi:hypothetical protein ABE10_02370, partial [Bacillus toyonensis]|nr:hypothetical protein [Bacillus toyonensis]